MVGRVAAGNIAPSRFLIETAGVDCQVTQASSPTAAPIVGISQRGQRNPPYSTLQDGYAAIAGENIHMYINPWDSEAPIELGGTVAAGDKLTADSSGKAVTASASDYVGGTALMAGTSGQIISCQPLPPAIKA